MILTTPPEVYSPVVLAAVNDPVTGKGAFQFQGRDIPPVIHARPGTTLHVTYVNSMTRHSHEQCVDGSCMNMTNLHFHGLHVSPDAPQDDVISMMANPGETLHYSVVIPEDQPPGLYWYHTHPHGESYQQDLDGMSGAIVVDGIERYDPEIRNMTQRILVLRDRVTSKHDPTAQVWRNAVEVSQNCSTATEVPERIFTVNGVVRPRIPIAPKERQFWRIVNASPDLYADLKIDGEQLEIVALDGMPIGFHDPGRKTEFANHILLPPAGRVEAIVTGPRDGRVASLRTQCFDTGPDGDPNPTMVIADLVPGQSHANHPEIKGTVSGRAFYKPVPYKTLENVESRAPDYTVRFTEDKHGFYINDRKYGPNDPPMTTASIGSYYHWRVVNSTREVHPFHIHQVHFLVYSRNDQSMKQPVWLDTVNVPVGESLDIVMDFTDPIIRGVSLFHCHLLSHEDKGMMAKVLFK
ncbi:multicopper oxidase family protein [Edaphobacter albus]|uniref:multicopper oxidase family protein n=1 Tax=Edaphobacter sp. 4G125 TaxID=2763071 RepID=UPI00164855BA|nr:multicopper oxidase family protein [Edaphobacter sp. 4G125]QNI37989.1 multicopper oxidase domain-containing protein [Edaphobacter sp. 4G125]